MVHVNAVIFAAIAAPAAAWWDVGHATVGAIASLSMKNGQAIQNLEAILSYMDTIYTDEYGEWPFGNFSVDASERPPQKSNKLAWAGVWPDIAKGFYNVKLFDNWHYINKKYDPDNLDTEGTGCNTDSDTNIVTTTTGLVSQVPDVFRGRPTARWYQHFGINFITHNIGDAHQPFHAMGRCIIHNGKLDQDLGGNRWLLTMPDGTNTNAHAMWDSVAFVWGNDKQREIETSDNTYETFARELMAKLPLEKVQAYGFDVDLEKDGDPAQFSERFQIWLEESNEIAIQTYNQTTMNGTVDQALLDWVVEVSEYRVAAAGYRLGALLDGMLSKLEPIEPFSKTDTVAIAEPSVTESTGSNGVNVGAIVGAAVGCLIAGVVGGFLGGRFLQKRADKKRFSNSESTTAFA